MGYFPGERLVKGKKNINELCFQLKKLRKETKITV